MSSMSVWEKLCASSCYFGDEGDKDDQRDGYDKEDEW